MKKSDQIKFVIIRTIGNFLVLFMIFGFFATFGPVLYYEASYRLDKANGTIYKIPDISNLSDLNKFIAQNKNKEIQDNQSSLIIRDQGNNIIIPRTTDFSIIIPKIGISAKIFPNVNPGNPDEFLPILKQGVAHASGTLLPGENGNIYIFAHSTDNFWDVGRYNAIFYLLKELNQKDEVAIFYNDKRYNYEVFDKKIVDPDKVNYLLPNKEKGEVLTLQTCWPPGTTWKRLLIFAKPI